MRQVLLMRPRWQDPPGADEPKEKFHWLQATPEDPRILLAPLQLIYLSAPDPALWQEFARCPKAWLIFTSPTSVEAFSRWVTQHTLAPAPALAAPGLELAAVGAATRDRLALLVDRGFLNLEQASRALCAEDSERADAAALLAQLRVCGLGQERQWAGQRVFLVEGQGNRPTLADGLAAMGAAVTRLPLYERVDIDWPQSLLSMIQAAAPHTVGVVITSSSVIDRSLKLLRDHQINPVQLVWCTQHQTIAQSLLAAGIARVRKIRLEPTRLTQDLFEDEHYW